MGRASSRVFHMAFIIIFFLISFCCTRIPIAKSAFNAVEYFKIVPVLKEGNFDLGLAATNIEKKLPGKHKDHLKAFILANFRVLLGLKSFDTRNVGHQYFSPSPSPAPAPVRHARPPSHHYHILPAAHKIIQKKGKDAKFRRVLTAVLASAGITCVLTAAGLFFYCQRWKKQKRRRKLNAFTYRNECISKFMNSQSSVKKVSSDPGPDQFYLKSLESALEPENGTKQRASISKIDESEESCKKSTRSESDRSRCSSIVDIEMATANGASQLVKFDENQENVEVHAFGDKLVSEEAHSSDDESFHSFCDSRSSQMRPSNASECCNLSDYPEIIVSEDASNPFSAPPPPPPPPPPHMHASPPLPIISRKTVTPDILNSSKSTGIPPPPCPPPSRSNANFTKIPLPPNSKFNQEMPLGKDGSPLPKLKPLHWDKVRATPDRSTVWDKLRTSSFEFDEEMIESLFCYNMHNPMKSEDGKSKTSSPSKHVLEPKRLQNITILSKALNATAEQLCGALIRGDGLSLQDLEALSKMVPTKEEEVKLANYKGDILELGSAEKLVKAMLKIPFSFSRIEAMLYRETFEDEVFHLRKSFSTLEEACKELRSSRLFLKLLEAVLKTGNRMNVGTIRGGAKAFKLDALLKLSDVKGTDGKTTLLHFVVQEIIRSEGIRVSESIMGKINQKSKIETIEDKEENYRTMGLDLVSGLSTELCNVKKTATIDLDVLASSVANLANGMTKLRDLVEKDMIMEEKVGNFVNSMRSFLSYAQIKLKELQDHENGVLLLVKEITEYFHGDVSREESNPLRIFVIVRDFLSMLEHVCKELRCLKAPRTHNPLAPFK